MSVNIISLTEGFLFLIIGTITLISLKMIKTNHLLTGPRDPLAFLQEFRISAIKNYGDFMTFIKRRTSNIRLEKEDDLHQLQEMPPYFTGRQDELANLITAHNKDTSIFGIWGMGGVGKTSLALKFARELSPVYPDAQFFLDLKGTSNDPLSTLEAMVQIIRAFNPGLELSNDQDNITNLFQTLLYKRRVIILADNAASAAQIAPLMPPKNCLLIVTARQHFTLPGMHNITIKPLSTEDSQSLLRKLVPNLDIEMEDLELCGNLPGVITSVASIVEKNESFKPRESVKVLKDYELMSGLAEEFFKSNYEALPKTTRLRWCQLAVLPKSFDKQLATNMWNIDQVSAQDILGDLVVHSLLNWHELGESTESRSRAIGLYQFNDLARLFAMNEICGLSPNSKFDRW